MSYCVKKGVILQELNQKETKNKIKLLLENAMNKKLDMFCRSGLRPAGTFIQTVVSKSAEIKNTGSYHPTRFRAQALLLFGTAAKTNRGTVSG